MVQARTLGTLTASWHTLLDVALRTSVVYLALLVGLRLTGPRQLGQMSTFDLVLLLIIANAVQNAMVGPDTSLAGGLVAAGVLIGWHRVIDWWRVRSRGVSKLLAGEGIMLIHDGKILQEHCERAGITHDELRQALPEHGVANLQDGMLAGLEPDAAISGGRYDATAAGPAPRVPQREGARGAREAAVCRGHPATDARGADSRELEGGARAGGAEADRGPPHPQSQVGRRDPGHLRVPRGGEARAHARADGQVPPEAHGSQGHRRPGARPAQRAASAEGPVDARRGGGQAQA